MTLINQLKAWGAGDDDAIPLADAALALSAIGRAGLSVERYQNYLRRLAEEIAIRHTALGGRGAPDTAALRLEALREVIALAHGFTGDAETYDDLQNADLARVIDRRKGMPITLAILYIHAARAQGWDAQGLNFPGHFLVRLDRDAERVIFDPFAGASVLQAADLRRILKETQGPDAELSATYYEPASNRAILIRLQNNIKTRMIAGEDYEGALRIVETMRLLDPDEYRLLLDEGVLNARTRRLEAAIAALEDYMTRAPDGRDRHEAAILLQSLRGFAS